MYDVCPIVELANDGDASREGKIKAYSTVVLLGRDGRMVGKVSSHVHSETRNEYTPAVMCLACSFLVSAILHFCLHECAYL